MKSMSCSSHFGLLHKNVMCVKLIGMSIGSSISIKDCLMKHACCSLEKRFVLKKLIQFST